MDTMTSLNSWWFDNSLNIYYSMSFSIDGLKLVKSLLICSKANGNKDRQAGILRVRAIAQQQSWWKEEELFA